MYIFKPLPVYTIYIYNIYKHYTRRGSMYISINIFFGNLYNSATRYELLNATTFKWNIMYIYIYTYNMYIYIHVYIFTLHKHRNKCDGYMYKHILHLILYSIC